MIKQSRSFLIHWLTDDLRTATDKTTEHSLYYESSVSSRLDFPSASSEKTALANWLWKSWRRCLEEVKMENNNKKNFTDK